ncbi:hypothetical protein U9M48_040519 [Paspalum notatum var. saurae]|uniref:Tyrosinase copper-binding domain-containing protein n=1 Tax=Paspalum notatum var. saurae TaxID=547442 RepID=A0AAQ3UL81_PASNO
MNGCMARVCAGSSTLVPFSPVTSTTPACPSKKTTVAASRRSRSVSCKATGGDEGLLWLPRREVLTGLTGVAAGLVGYPGLASAEDTCLKGDKVTEKIVECTDPAGGKIPCPPTSTSKIIDFKPESAVRRIRHPAHLLSRENQEKYKEAVAKMKALPAEHPLSFTEQAAIHEAYCDGHYRFDPTNKDRPFDVHFSWIFGPWHRMSLYFYERALGQLIGDDTFALPYWNWDTPAGMVVPPIFRGASANPLYDTNRNSMLVDKLLDLDYLTSLQKPGGAVILPFDESPHSDKYKELVYSNLALLHQQQIRGGRGARNFLGEKFCTEASVKSQGLTTNELRDKKTKAQGSLERMAHTSLHMWVGKNPPSGVACSADTGGVLAHDGNYNCRNDMGFLGSSGRDPLFYSHHANVDRLWHIWSTKLRGKGFPDPEWLDTSFVFYDGIDNPQRVRIKFRDVLDAANLGYTYDKESEKDLPWVKCDLRTLVPHDKGAAPRAKTRGAAPAQYPLTLNKGTPVEVPDVALPAAEPGKQRVLIIDGIVYDPADQNKFDVAINVPKEKVGEVGPTHVEYAGSFSIVPSSKEGGGDLEGKVALCIEEVLKDIGAASDEDVDVVLVPRTAADIKLSVPPVIENFDRDD